VNIFILNFFILTSSESISSVLLNKDTLDWVWWCIFVILALGRLRQEDVEFKANLGYIVRTCFKKKIGLGTGDSCL
jgi:hypothetical protein